MNYTKIRVQFNSIVQSDGTKLKKIEKMFKLLKRENPDLSDDFAFECCVEYYNKYTYKKKNTSQKYLG